MNIKNDMDHLITIYKQQFDLENCTFSRIAHNDALVAIVYKVTRASGESLILKICERPQDYFREMYFLNHFKTSLPVAQIINVFEPNADIHGAILMNHFSGSLLQGEDLTEKLAFDLGSLLARVHLNRTTAYGDLTEPNNLSSNPMTPFTSKFEEGLLECKHNLPQTLQEQCHRYYDTHIDRLKSVDGPCIIHRDFRLGNIMVKDGKIQGIIDWASARASFAEDDFCPLEFGEWPINAANKQSFLMGYASIRSIPDYNSVMPLLRLNRAIATIGFTVKRGTWDNSSSGLYKVNREFLDSFFKQ